MEELIGFFVEEGEKECFAACLFTCYSFLKPDTVLETAWRHGLCVRTTPKWPSVPLTSLARFCDVRTDFAMPFVIQCVGEVFDRLDGLEAATKKEEQAAEDLDTVRPTPFQPFRSVWASIGLLTSWVVGQMDAPLALPAHAQQGAMGYTQPDPNMMQQGNGYQQQAQMQQQQRFDQMQVSKLSA